MCGVCKICLSAHSADQRHVHVQFIMLDQLKKLASQILFGCQMCLSACMLAMCRSAKSSFAEVRVNAVKMHYSILSAPKLNCM